VDGSRRRSTLRRGAARGFSILQGFSPNPITAFASALSARRPFATPSSITSRSFCHCCIGHLVAAHQVENFRTRIVDGDVWLYEQINGGSAVGRANGTIGLGHYQFYARLHDFVREAAIELNRVRQGRLSTLSGLQPDPLFRSPWFELTSISHARDCPRRLAPASTSAKLLRPTDAAPCGIDPRAHALADGLHVAQFVEKFNISWITQTPMPVAIRGETNPCTENLYHLRDDPLLR